MIKECPKCGCNDIHEILCAGRKLQPRCAECYWVGKPEIPTKRAVKTVKTVHVDQFGGIVFEVFDKYGQPMLHSQTYRNRTTALNELEKFMKHSETDKDGGPYTAVLWPDIVEVKGEPFKFKKGKLVKHKA